MEKSFDKMVDKLLKHSVNEIDTDSLEKIVDEVILLDAREWNEFEVSHIEGAAFVGFKNLDLDPVKKLPKDKPIVVYCSVGYRSEKVTEKLNALGYTNVSNFVGGIFDWKNKGNEVVDPNGTTEKVHGFNKNWSKWLENAHIVVDRNTNVRKVH